MATDPEQDRLHFDIQRKYVEFLEDTTPSSKLMKDSNYDKIKSMLTNKEIRLIININNLRTRDQERCSNLLEKGFEEMPILQRALKEVVTTIDPEFAKEKEEFFVGLEGSFGIKHVTPRTLSSHFLGNTVCVEGIVTRCSHITPKLIRSVHYCPTTKKTIERKYADITNFDTLPTAIAYPTKDDDGNILETEYGLSKYKDYQTITLQEMPEKAPTGQLPRSLEIHIENDLVDKAKPGDRILVVGVYRCLPGKQGGYSTGVFRSILLGNHIQSLSKDANMTISSDDIKACKKFSRTSNPYEVLSRSIAPSIHGHEFIKKAILCLLLGGVEKNLKNGTRLRGDINVLLIGDPSVAKSQILRYVQNVAPRVVMTTGRGSSGVGLTAAVTTDFETGERRLEAGAMVLADRGIVCIDEFDKMSDADRTAIHEVMEQGKVTIAKAGIHARLNARTSVLAAANPIAGKYDEYKTPMENIALQDSLLSRFDLLFIILDTVENEHDRKVADHVLRMHRYRNPEEKHGDATPLIQAEFNLTTKVFTQEEENRSKTKEMNIYEKYDNLLYGKDTRHSKPLSMEFIKKYIHIAKCIKPALTQEASRVISEEYRRLRSFDSKEMAKTQPVTARTLETLIRLSTAHARARMSKLVEKRDANAAIELVQYACFKEVLEKKKKRNADDGEEEDEEMEVDGEEHENGENGHSISKKQKVDENGASAQIPQNGDTELTHPIIENFVDTDSISADKLNVFKSRISKIFAASREESLTMDQMRETLIEEFTDNEIKSGFEKMSEEGVVILSEGYVFII